MITSNCHTHTTFSDGADTPRKMVEAALSRGFTSLGFSDHAYTPLDPVCGMPRDRFPSYAEEIRRLKQEYAGKIQIYLGIENDSLYPWPSEGLDYVIGSVHDVPLDDLKTVCVDSSGMQFWEGIRYLGGDERKLVSCYYKTLTDMLTTQRQDVVGHFDLLTKFNAGNELFDARSDWYRELVLDAVEAVKVSGCILEVNTGGMSRGYTTEPYPAPWILRECHKLGIPVTVSSDSHGTDTLDAYFDDMERLLKDVGYTEIWQLHDGSFSAYRL